ncbi:proline--tRNA ligase [Candidatus Aerophobetes bacterium]|uniref:Proline--tRNA ligase n=1 Tax=Aerophobetes bacterium TaxID=2030807 RepID=A0A523USM9_UNCAE|nr:MAG: proline--tRNA ligase [Candidatus Aerophobetes bacterium]
MKNSITPKEENFSQWYIDLVLKAKLADYAPVKGCMVIRPNGYLIWENIQKNLDRMFKESGHVNAYFPLLIPESFIQKEKEHMEGFSPECAVVTYGGGKELKEPLVIRPTSETVVWSMYARWITSYRDLPLLMNEWCNVVRWELRPRLFLRTLEFLWQEGHTAHETHEEAEEEVLRMLGIYKNFVEEYMAIPVYEGQKSESERFAGALQTYTIEALTQDRKALQLGTSHNLGQKFARAFDVKFATREGGEDYVWATSWGVSTRLIGALIMSHADNKGIIVPPKLAPLPVVIVPIYYSASERSKVLSFIQSLYLSLREDFNIKIDDREEHRPSYKFNEWELQGIPLRIEVGPKDVGKKQAILVRRDTGEKISVSLNEVPSRIPALLDEIQKNLFEKAKEFRDENTFKIDTFEDFQKIINHKGGFIYAHWCGLPECEAKIKSLTAATLRCILLYNEKEKGKCVYCGGKSSQRVLFAKAY